MAYTDVTHPVVVNVTKISNFSTDTHLRRMALVSEGATTLAVGGYTRTTSSDYGTVLTAGSEAYIQATNFFSNAGNSKELVVIEVGTGSKATKVAALKNFIDNEELKCFIYICPKSFYNVIGTPVTATATMAATAITVTADEKTLTELLLTGFDAVNRPIGVTFSTADKVEYNPYTGIYKLVDGVSTSSGFPITATLTDTNANDAEIGKIIFTANGNTQTPAIDYSVDYTIEDTSFVNMLQAYNSIDNEFQFFVPVDKDTDPSADANDDYFDDLLNVMTIKNNTEVASQEVAAAVAGVCAGNYFDISTTMPGSSLNYKKVNITPYSYTKSMKQNLINKPYTFVDTLASNNVILNARMRDGKAWEYYFFWFWTNYKVTDKITKLLLNGQNYPVSAVRFDQNGIDTIHQVIKTVLNDMVSLGVLTTFAQSYDQTTGEFTNEGEIVIPNYYTFLASNPEDYENEKLTGISCYLQIGKFVRQVVWNVTLGY